MEDDGDAAPARPDGEAEDSEESGGGDAAGEPQPDTASDEEEEHFDISLPPSHSYMGAGLEAVCGRAVLEAGWRGRLPALAQPGAVFPGETVPMLLADPHDIAMLNKTLREDKLFCLLCPDESGLLVSGFGVVCEVFECAGAGAGGGGGGEEATLSFKARATHRCRFTDHLPSNALFMYLYSRMREVSVEVLPELMPPPPLHGARLASLDPLRAPNTPMDRCLRRMDAVTTPWPLFLYERVDYRALRDAIHTYFKATLQLASLPEDPVALSFWVARNLPLSARDRLALLAVDDALLRLHMEAADIARQSVLCCAGCAASVARREHAVAMSADGAAAHYTNLGGYRHDVVTVSQVSNVHLTGAPSAEYSWFPGYCWTIAVCAVCMAHLGWRFDASRRTLRPSSFYALCRGAVQPRAADRAPLPPLPAPAPRARLPPALLAPAHHPR